MNCLLTHTRISFRSAGKIDGKGKFNRGNRVWFAGNHRTKPEIEIMQTPRPVISYAYGLGVVVVCVHIVFDIMCFLMPGFSNKNRNMIETREAERGRGWQAKWENEKRHKFYGIFITHKASPDCKYRFRWVCLLGKHIPRKRDTCIATTQINQSKLEIPMVQKKGNGKEIKLEWQIVIVSVRGSGASGCFVWQSIVRISFANAKLSALHFEFVLPS